MEKEISVFNEIFDVNIIETDVLKPVEQVIIWDSFNIMEFLSEMSERFNEDIDIMQISMVVTVEDVLLIIKKCMKSS